jgi:hypothetical protein
MGTAARAVAWGGQGTVTVMGLGRGEGGAYLSGRVVVEHRVHQVPLVDLIAKGDTITYTPGHQAMK